MYVNLAHPQHTSSKQIIQGKPLMPRTTQSLASPLPNARLSRTTSPHSPLRIRCLDRALRTPIFYLYLRGRVVGVYFFMEATGSRRAMATRTKRSEGKRLIAIFALVAMLDVAGAKIDI
eukprot:754516-Hanusia_phi.AAC.6